MLAAETRKQVGTLQVQQEKSACSLGRGSLEGSLLFSSFFLSACGRGRVLGLRAILPMGVFRHVFFSWLWDGGPETLSGPVYHPPPPPHPAASWDKHISVMRQDSKRLGNSLASGIGKLRQTAEHNGGAIYRQRQKVASLEITSRSQLCFSSRPRKAAKPGWQLQNQP